MRALAILWVAGAVVGCAGAPPKAEPSPSPTATTFRVLTINELALPVGVLPAGTVQVGDGQFALKDLSVYESELPPTEVSALLVRNGFLSAYFRQFDTANEGNRPKNSLIFIVLFTDAAGAQTTLTDLTDARLRGGYYEMSLGGTVGERSRGMTADFTGSGTTGPVSVADVLFTQSNALLVARTMDDIGTVSPQDAIQFAKAELAWLRR